MATTITKISRSNIVTNLDTYTHTALSTAVYEVKMTVSEIPPSGIIITIQKNGSTVSNTSAPASTKSVINLSAQIPAVPTDTLSVILSSSTASDALPNSFKGILIITPVVA